jgi:hypothetical protein
MIVLFDLFAAITLANLDCLQNAESITQAAQLDARSGGFWRLVFGR